MPHSHATHPKKLLSLHPLSTNEALKAALQVKLSDVKALEKKQKGKKS